MAKWNKLLKKRRYLETFFNRSHMSLREVKQVLTIIHELQMTDEDIMLRRSIGGVDIGPSYSMIVLNDGRRRGRDLGLKEGRIWLPQLREKPFSVYGRAWAYHKRVDELIQKHGPDAVFPIADYNLQTEDHFTKEPLSDEQLKSLEEASEDSDLDSCPTEERVDHLSPGKKESTDSEPGVAEERNGQFSQEGNPEGFKWELSFGDGKQGVSESKQPSLSQAKAFDGKTESDKGELSHPSDASRSFQKGSANPADRPRHSGFAEKSSKQNGFITGSSELPESGVTLPSKKLPSALQGKTFDGVMDSSTAGFDEPLGDVSSPLNNPFSFGTFALSGAKGRRVVGNQSMITNPSTKVDLKSLINSAELSDGLDDQFLNTDPGSGFSRESKFRDGNPGGYIDKNKATLEKRQVKAEARKIAEHFTGFFIANEVGIGAEETPRIHSGKLAKELFGKSMRLSSARKEEKGAGLKLVLVDISPSCEAIRDACFAAALAIADQDPDVVVMAHFNGWTADMADAVIVGQRQDEVPHIYGDRLKDFEDFLKKGKVSGAIAFGDDDAEEVYSLLSHYCPLLWLSPDDEEHCQYRLKQMDRRNERVFDKARAYIIGGVHDAKTAVAGLRKLKKGR